MIKKYRWCLKNDGIVSIDMILYIFLFSFISSLIFKGHINNMRIKSYIDRKLKLESKEELIINYIMEEIKESDYYIKSSDIKKFDSKHPNNLNYILVKENGDIHRFTTYIIERGRLRRLSVNHTRLPSESLLYNSGGKNLLAEEVSKVEMKIDDGLISIRVCLDNERDYLKVFKIRSRHYET